MRRLGVAYLRRSVGEVLAASHDPPGAEARATDEATGEMDPEYGTSGLIGADAASLC
jgi:hypothetical protein